MSEDNKDILSDLFAPYRQCPVCLWHVAGEHSPEQCEELRVCVQDIEQMVRERPSDEKELVL